MPSGSHIGRQVGRRSVDQRADALALFLEERLCEGFVIETRTDTHAIIAPIRTFSGRVAAAGASSTSTPEIGMNRSMNGAIR